MTKRVSNSRANQHNGPMARQVRQYHGHARSAGAAGAMPINVDKAFDIAARAMTFGNQKTGAHRKASGRGS